MALATKDLLLSVEHDSDRSLPLHLLLYLKSMLCSGWRSLSMIASILLMVSFSAVALSYAAFTLAVEISSDHTVYGSDTASKRPEVIHFLWRFTDPMRMGPNHGQVRPGSERMRCEKNRVSWSSGCVQKLNSCERLRTVPIYICQCSYPTEVSVAMVLINKPANANWLASNRHRTIDIIPLAISHLIDLTCQCLGQLLSTQQPFYL
ncbi:hypothetical protein PFLUV_G00225250 [Perca fluviatilis]|uniref:Uncharacterized protein n=1 Tax=Perca fluviatilis TaxID=8168 RepID=A0A6A5EIU0_PERFL|nr:hypothetical protein PFLUV_G00225250 [Perca fluviatilis]